MYAVRPHYGCVWSAILCLDSCAVVLLVTGLFLFRDVNYVYVSE